MNELFRQHIESLQLAFEILHDCPPFSIQTIPTGLPTAGVYVLYEHGRPMYVGRTNRMKPRLQEHGRPSSSSDSAPFAFRIAREDCNMLKASYQKVGSRKHLMTDERFKEAFTTAKRRVRAMQIQVVEETNPLRQALLEMYVALVLNAPYNDFDNH